MRETFKWVFELSATAKGHLGSDMSIRGGLYPVVRELKHPFYSKHKELRPL